MKRVYAAVAVVGLLSSVLAVGGPMSASQADPADPVSELVTEEPTNPDEPTDPDEPTACVIGPQASCPGADLAGRDLRGVDLSGADLASAVLDLADVSGADLAGAGLMQASMVQVVLDGANLASADLTSARVLRGSLRQVSGQQMHASWANFANADLSAGNLAGASLRGAMATEATFAGANLVGADLSGADLFGADLSGTDLTGAVLRNTSLLKARTDGSTVLTDADLSGATWIDGRECAEGSRGVCRTPDEGVQMEAELPGSAALAISLIGFALKLGDFAAQCAKNVDKFGHCWDTGGPDLNAKAQQIGDLRNQIDANQRELKAAMNAIFKKQSEEAMLTRYGLISKDLDHAKIAALKLQEFTKCLLLFTDLKYKPGDLRTCQLTDLNGDNPQDWPMRYFDDLYTGATGSFTDDMHSFGPAARLYFASLYQFGGKDQYLRSNLNDAANRIQGGIAGHQAQQGKDGLLDATFRWMNADVQGKLDGAMGEQPTFVPGSYLTQMNAWTNYYVDGEGAFFAPVIAALTIRATSPGQTEDERKAQESMAKTLEARVLRGIPAEPQWALSRQLDDFAVPLEYYDVKASEKAADPAVPGTDATRVGFVVGSDGKVYRIQTMYGPTRSPSGNPPMAFPTFNTLALVRSSIDRSGAKWSRLRTEYAQIVPNDGSSWWATFGSSYRGVNLKWTMGGQTFYPTYFVSDQSPGTRAPGGFGDNVTSANYHVPCTFPVRMLDQGVDVPGSFRLDTAGDTRYPDFGSQSFGARDNRDAKRTWNVHVNGREAYDTLVRTAAVPAFMIYSTYEGKAGQLQRRGTGVLWRCDGREGDTLAVTSASWVSVRALEPKGVFTRLSTRPVRFESCTDLRAADWRGIGQASARDQEMADDPELAGMRENAHRWNTEWYERNRHLDIDGDGIACELSQ